MPTFLVRIIETRDLVGIYVAANIDDLALLVDECTDPGSCEYLRMGAGGIMWHGPAISIPIEMPDDDNGDIAPDPIPWKDAALTESWWDDFYDFRDASRWRAIYPTQKTRPRGPALPQLAKPAAILPFRKRPK